MYKKTPPKQSIRKRSFLLFELLISLALITLCFVPLVKSQFLIRLATLNQLQEMQLEQAAQAAFCELKTKLYEKEHDWRALIEKNPSGALSQYQICTGKNNFVSYACQYTISHPLFAIANKPSQNKVGLIIDVDLLFISPQEKKFSFRRTLYLERLTA